jgi:YggT family protein
MTTLILTIRSLLDIFVAVLGLALALRVALPWFKVSPSHPVMRFLTTVTEPFVRPVRKVLGRGTIRWTRGGYVDLAPLVTIFVLWLLVALVNQILAWIIAPPLWIFRPGGDLERWLINLLGLVFQIYFFLLLLRILLQWLRVPYTNRYMRFLWNVTEPLLAPIRRRLPSFAGLDFSPVLLILLLSLLQMFLTSLIRVLV